MLCLVLEASDESRCGLQNTVGFFMPSEANVAPLDVTICSHASGTVGCGKFSGVGFSRREGV